MLEQVGEHALGFGHGAQAQVRGAVGRAHSVNTAGSWRRVERAGTASSTGSPPRRIWHDLRCALALAAMRAPSARRCSERAHNSISQPPHSPRPPQRVLKGQTPAREQFGDRQPRLAGPHGQLVAPVGHKDTNAGGGHDGDGGGTARTMESSAVKAMKWCGGTIRKRLSSQGPASRSRSNEASPGTWSNFQPRQAAQWRV